MSARYDPTPIRVVLLTGGARLEREVADFLDLLAAEPAIEVAGIYCEAARTGMRGVLVDLWKRRGLLAVPLTLQLAGRAIWQWVSGPRKAIRRRRLLRRCADRMFFIEQLHAPTVLAAISATRPDLGLVYGGPIVRSELFSLPKHGTLGIHHGKVPDYRGKKTTFWAMYNGESEVGVVIQRIGSRLDRGDIVAEARIAVGRKPLMIVKRELEREGMRAYVEAIHAIRTGSAMPRPQADGTGAPYQDPSAADILRFWLRYLRRLSGLRN